MNLDDFTDDNSSVATGQTVISPKEKKHFLFNIKESRERVRKLSSKEYKRDPAALLPPPPVFSLTPNPYSVRGIRSGHSRAKRHSRRTEVQVQVHKEEEREARLHEELELQSLGAVGGSDPGLSPEERAMLRDEQQYSEKSDTEEREL